NRLRDDTFIDCAPGPRQPGATKARRTSFPYISELMRACLIAPQAATIVGGAASVGTIRGDGTRGFVSAGVVPTLSASLVIRVPPSANSTVNRSLVLTSISRLLEFRHDFGPNKLLEKWACDVMSEFEPIVESLDELTGLFVRRDSRIPGQNLRFH